MGIIFLFHFRGLIQPVFENRENAFVTGGPYGQGPFAGRFQAVRAIGFLQAQRAQDRAESLLGMRF
jgi:hypothetical protein